MNAPLVSVEEYLETSYEPDREYVDGQLVERSLGTPVHGLMQALLASYLWPDRRQLAYAVLNSARMVIVPNRCYRVPDLMLLSLPVPRGKVVDTVPFAVVEVVSPDDRLGEQLRRCREFEERGVAVIVLLDPEGRRAYSFQGGALRETRFGTLTTPQGEIPFDTDALFRQFAEEYGE